jgi:GT2 family glycosyltransferase
MADLSIVIPNWNGKRFLEVCFQAIAAQKTDSVLETILVDNHSSDDSLEFTRKHFPWVRIVPLDTNTGFDGAVNAGIKAATGSLISLLNNDTELDPLWAQSLINAATTHPEVASFASKMLRFDERDVIDTCGDAMTWTGRSYKMGEGEKDLPPYDKERLVFGACAGASCYRRELFDAIGLFDETFFAYLEDVDISFRAQLAGFKCLFVPGAKVYHMVSATGGKGSAFGFEMMVKNHFHVIYKNFSLLQLLRYSPKLAYAEIRLAAAAVKHRFVPAYIRGCWRAFKEFPGMWAKRKAVQRLRSVDDAYLNTVIEPRFDYKPLWRALTHG